MDISLLRNSLKQQLIEDRYSRHNIRSRVKAELMASAEIADKLVEAENLILDWASQTFGYRSKNDRIDWLMTTCPLTPMEIMIEIVLAVLPVDGPQRIQSVCGKVAPLLGYPSIFDAVTTVAEIITVACEVDLYDLIPAKENDEGVLLIESNYEISEELHQYIANTKYLPPMIVPPLKIKSNFDYDYLTKQTSKILGGNNHHNLPIGLDALNLMNAIPLSLDLRMVAHREESKKPLDTAEKVQNFFRMVNSSQQVYQEIIEAGNKFYFTWVYDKRGRMYCRGYHISIQSTEYKKAIIEFADKVLIPVEDSL